MQLISPNAEKAKNITVDRNGSMEFEECNQALEYIYPLYHEDKITGIIDETPLLTDTQKEFYKHMIYARFNKILEYSYFHLQEKVYERD